MFTKVNSVSDFLDVLFGGTAYFHLEVRLHLWRRCFVTKTKIVCARCHGFTLKETLLCCYTHPLSVKIAFTISLKIDTNLLLLIKH